MGDPLLEEGHTVNAPFYRAKNLPVASPASGKSIGKSTFFPEGKRGIGSDKSKGGNRLPMYRINRTDLLHCMAFHTGKVPMHRPDIAPVVEEVPPFQRTVTTDAGSIPNRLHAGGSCVHLCRKKDPEHKEDP